MDIRYTWEKLLTTVDSLATGKGSIQERLDNAWVIALMRLEVDDFPEELQTDDRYGLLMAAINEGSLGVNNK